MLRPVLDDWLHELIRQAEEANRAEKSLTQKQTVTEKSLEDKTYHFESIRCGKEICKCARGKLHGPYWYSYIRVNDKIKSQYIGKSLTKDIEKKLKR